MTKKSIIITPVYTNTSCRSRDTLTDFIHKNDLVPRTIFSKLLV